MTLAKPVTFSGHKALRDKFLVLLIDPHGREPSKVVCRENTRREANWRVKQWDRDPLDMVAVVWPKWAPLPDGVKG